VKSLPENWEDSLATMGGNLSVARVAKHLNVSDSTVRRWMDDDSRFAVRIDSRRQPAQSINYDVEITDRLDDVVIIHERGTTTLQISVNDLCQVLFDARQEINRLRDHKRLLLSELNRERHAAHRRNSRASTVHQGDEPTRRALSYSDLAPDT